MKKILAIILLGTMMISMLTACNKKKDENTFVLGLDDAFPPMGFVDENQKIVGFDIDIVVVDYSVAKHIRRFDQCFKQIWLDHKGLHITKQAAKDIINNKITIGVLNGPAIYFRALRSARNTI